MNEDKKICVTPKGTKAFKENPLFLTWKQIKFLVENWESPKFCDGVRVHA